MRLQYTPLLWLLLAAAAVAVLLGINTWRQRAMPGARAFALLMLMAGLWAGANAVEVAVTGLPAKVFWTNVQYLAIAGIPPEWLYFTIRYTGAIDRSERRRLLWLFLIPAVTLLLVWTNDAHGLMRQNVSLDTSAGYAVVVKTYGPWFWVHTVYSYLLIAASVVILLSSLRRASPDVRGQMVALLAGLLLPVVANGIYILGLNPYPWIDPTPVVFTIAGAIFILAVQRYRLFDLVPVARATVVDSIADAMLVIDDRGRLLDMNTAARALFAGAGSQVIGKDAASVFSAWPDLRDFCRRQGQTEGEFALGTPDRLRYFSAHVSPITRGTRPFGRLILLHDMTERREFSRRLIEAQENERRAIARELHDEAGQLLATLLLGLGSIQNHAPSPEIAKAMAELRGIADNVMQSLHRLAVDLRPVSLDRLGLEPALRQYTTTLSQQKNLTVSLAITDIASERLPPDVETTVYRVVQEALTNAVRHARATEIAVIIERRPATRGVGDRLIAIIEDNGEGFDPTTSPEGRLGLLGMRERAELANGTLSIESIPGHGTAIYLDLPWPVERG